MNKGIVNKVIKALGGLGIAGLVVSTIAISVKADAYSGITIDGDFSDWAQLRVASLISMSSLRPHQ